MSTYSAPPPQPKEMTTHSDAYLQDPPTVLQRGLWFCYNFSVPMYQGLSCPEGVPGTDHSPLTGAKEFLMP